MFSTYPSSGASMGVSPSWINIDCNGFVLELGFTLERQEMRNIMNKETDLDFNTFM